MKEGSLTVTYIAGNDAWGADDWVVLAAFRYCLGRRTYIVSECVDWLIKYWGDVAPKVRTQIAQELSRARIADDELRIPLGTGAPTMCLPLGMDCDRAQWMRLIAVIEEGGE